jgi:hypothetical protein
MNTEIECKERKFSFIRYQIDCSALYVRIFIVEMCEYIFTRLPDLHESDEINRLYSKDRLFDD